MLNRVNTAIITFNWKLPHREIPPWREVLISLTIFAIYIAVYRFILVRLPILYAWKTQEAAEPVTEKIKAAKAYAGEERLAVGASAFKTNEEGSFR